MSKLSDLQKEQLKKCVIDCTIRRSTTLEIQEYVKSKMNVELSTEYLRHLRKSLKKDLGKQLQSYQTDRVSYVDAMVFQRVKELEQNQDILRRIIEHNDDKPEVQVKAVVALNETTVLIRSLFEMLPNICSLGVDAFGNNNNNPSSLVTTASAPGYNNNYNNSATTISNNNYSRWCSNCNRMHLLDKNGHRKCPEWKVGAPEEEIEGYYETDDIDPNAKF